MAEQRKGSDQRNGLSGREAIERVRRDLPQLLGRPVEAVLGLQRADDKGWTVTVQVVELSRIPLLRGDDRRAWRACRLSP
jgi:hypothetical protein